METRVMRQNAVKRISLTGIGSGASIRITFIIGALCRLVIILITNRPAMTDWYIPFLDAGKSNPLNPWGVWLNNGGAEEAFPYGYVLLFAYMPLQLACDVLSIDGAIGYIATSLAIEIFTLYFIWKLAGSIALNSNASTAVSSYLLSPVVIFSTYGLGLNDGLPTLLLLVSLTFLVGAQTRLAGFTLALACSAKLSMLAALPLTILFLSRAKWARKRFIPFTGCFSITAFLLLAPQLLLNDARRMLFAPSEFRRLLDVRIPILDGVDLVALPMILFLLLWAFAMLRMLSLQILGLGLALWFLAIAVLAPYSPGWFLWGFTLLLCASNLTNSRQFLLIQGWSLFYLGAVFIFGNNALFPSFQTENVALPNFPDAVDFAFGGTAGALYFTVYLLSAIMIGRLLWQNVVEGSGFLLVRKRPIMIGIAGDSASGKDHLASHLSFLFGVDLVTRVSGDDFHRWDRHSVNWRYTTHLNPLANELESKSQVLRELAAGKKPHVRPYDHSLGRRHKPIRITSNDVVISSGLHALMVPDASQLYDLRIFIVMEEDLRRWFKLRRDTSVRGHTAEQVLQSIARRSADYTTFIEPQARTADVIFRIETVDQFSISEKLADIGPDAPLPRLRLEVSARGEGSVLELRRVLVGLMGCNIEQVEDPSYLGQTILIEGELEPDDYDLALSLLSPQISQILHPDHTWASGVTGMMQFFTLLHLSRHLERGRL